MTIMMDLLEDYLDLRHYKSERIDGTVPWKERQVVASDCKVQVGRDLSCCT